MDIEMLMGAEFFNLQRATKECTVLRGCPVVFVVEARFWIHGGKNQGQPANESSPKMPNKTVTAYLCHNH